MTTVQIYGLLSVLLVSLISLIGIFALSINKKLLSSSLLFLVSLAAGTFLGDVFLHLLPELVEHGEFGVETGFIILGGIIFAFILEKILHRRHCHVPTSSSHPHPFAIMNLVGDSVHNFVDGMIIGASYLLSIEIGIATTIAIMLHEIPQEIGDFGVLVHGGFSRKKALLVNFMTALTAFLGLIFAFILGNYTESAHEILVPIAIGFFIYIAGSDLIPEMHKETKLTQGLLQILFFVIGIALMTLVLFLEIGH